MPTFAERLHAAVIAKRTPALVGLDPRLDQLPDLVVESARRRQAGARPSSAARAGGDARAAVTADAYEEFCCRIIDVVAPLVPAVKPQAAFFEECGPAGCAALARVMRHARNAGLLVICDAKRGDIGSTAEAYARAYLAGSDADAAPWAADALTVNPYLGRDTLEPFVQTAVAREAGLYVLVRTSNPGAGTFQDLVAGMRNGERGMRNPTGRSLDDSSEIRVFEHVAVMVEELAAATCGGGDYGAVGAVVGATYPQELAELRQRLPHAPLLVPGYGSQGGNASDVAAAFAPDGRGALVNNSRGINYAYRRAPYAERYAPAEWEQAVAAATADMIADLAAHTPAGALRDSST